MSIEEWAKTVMNIAGPAYATYGAIQTARTMKQTAAEATQLQGEQLRVLAKAMGVDEQRMQLIAQQYALTSGAAQQFLQLAINQGESTSEAVSRWIGALEAYSKGDRPAFAYEPGLKMFEKSEAAELAGLRNQQRDAIRNIQNTVPARDNMAAYMNAIHNVNIAAADASAGIKAGYETKRQEYVLGVDKELRTALANLPGDVAQRQAVLGGLGANLASTPIPTSQMTDIARTYGEPVGRAVEQLQGQQSQLGTLSKYLTDILRPEEKQSPLLKQEEEPELGSIPSLRPSVQYSTIPGI